MGNMNRVGDGMYERCMMMRFNLISRPMLLGKNNREDSDLVSSSSTDVVIKAISLLCS